MVKNLVVEKRDIARDALKDLNGLVMSKYLDRVDCLKARELVMLEALKEIAK